MIPKRFAPLLFGLVLSGLMSMLVSGVSTLRATGLRPDFVALWMGAWLASWSVAFPVVLVVAPFTRKVVDRLVSEA